MKHETADSGSSRHARFVDSLSAYSRQHREQQLKLRRRAPADIDGRRHALVEPSWKCVAAHGPTFPGRRSLGVGGRSGLHVEGEVDHFVAND